MIDRLHEISTDLDTGLIHRKEKPYQGPNQRPATVEQTYDPMDWTSTVRVNTAAPRGIPNPTGHQSTRPEDQDLIGKRAKWVSQGEIDKRRYENRCLRCGRHGCRLLQCPLLPAINPNRSQVQRPQQPYRGPRVTTASVEDSKTTVELALKKRPTTYTPCVEEASTSEEEDDLSGNE
jgi:hypothetical protein